MVKLMDEGINKIKKTGVFTTNVTAWAARDPNDKNWQNLKAHFIAAYDAHLESGPTANTAGYHEAAAALWTKYRETSFATVTIALLLIRN